MAEPSDARDFDRALSDRILIAANALNLMMRAAAMVGMTVSVDLAERGGYTEVVVRLEASDVG